MRAGPQEKYTTVRTVVVLPGPLEVPHANRVEGILVCPVYPKGHESGGEETTEIASAQRSGKTQQVMSLCRVHNLK